MTATTTATRTWTCLCGSFKGTATDEPAMTAFCHCLQCRRFVGNCNKVAAFMADHVSFEGGEDSDKLIKYESSPGIFRCSCATCGAFAYKHVTIISK